MIEKCKISVNEKKIVRCCFGVNEVVEKLILVTYGCNFGVQIKVF